jgi:hypothetical protein
MSEQDPLLKAFMLELIDYFKSDKPKKVMFNGAQLVFKGDELWVEAVPVPTPNPDSTRRPTEEQLLQAARDFIAYPNQSDEYMKPAKQAIVELIDSVIGENARMGADGLTYEEMQGAIRIQERQRKYLRLLQGDYSD